tara:strand:+ start:465 stop:674 length:210 start_codon:yes stop_codon:yes gene_type:complete
METIMKSYEYIYEKILKDLEKYISKNKNNKLYYVDEDGLETEAVFDFTPTKDEIEGLLIYLNKEKIPQA